MRNKIETKLKPVLIGIIVFLSIIVTITNLGFKKNFVGDDAGVASLFAKTFVNLSFYTWDNLSAPGKLNVTSILSLLWSSFILTLSKLGLDVNLISRLSYFIFFSFSGTGMFYLVTLLLKIQKISLRKNLIYYAAFVSSLLYMFNHYSMWLASFPIIPYHSSYILLPWIISLFIYNLQVKITFVTVFAFSLLTLLLFSGNPSNTLSILFFLIAYFMFIVKELKRSSVIFVISSIFFVLLLTSFIYIPVLASKSNPYGYVGSSQDQLGSLFLNSTFTAFYNLFRMAGVPTWQNTPFYNLYNQNTFFILMGFFIPFIVIVSYLIPTSFHKLKTFFLALIIFTFFLTAGVNEPFNNLFLLIFNNLPYFEMYRAIYPKFAYYIVLSYSVLIGIFIVDLHLWKNHWNKYKYFIIFIPLLIILYNFPFFVGKIPNKDYLSKIPEEYLLAYKYLDAGSSDFKILSLPPAPNGSGLLLGWNENKYVGPHPDRFFFNYPVLDSFWFIGNGFKNLDNGDSWQGTKFEKYFLEAFNVLKYLNIKYLVVHKDFVENYIFQPNNVNVKITGKLKSRTLIALLKSVKGLELIEDNIYFNLYRMPEKDILARFYIPEKLITSQNQFGALFNKSSKNKNTDIAILSRPFSNLELAASTSVPKVNFLKINPTKYRVKLKNIDRPFLLVFSETFSPHWNATIKMPPENNLRISESDHLLVNGYANAWIIKPFKSDRQEYDILIEFELQKYFQYGLIISITALVGSIIFVFYNIGKKYAHK
ncbi:hypothetical protein A2954_02760 [Candidatus Roizmanbacteria bacterium RIFCSPLOWO2_01_FULL_37_12]|uniref:Membrane protein 6-pyruvoyl-tetrahydropterin synthase-related domain-containing protein n=1 Tax=Candidatus Roizmanbacteria bacterium RIFCSPLOWO2_01_FULL_37_12 TaxID=1802056 RepID=A0A1F7IAC5_9BACT|nr:MAG: hypothetical protein A3D76_03645 [Candidatus Roizmanbacteria bacterium RIFCSPHIGHO2_02_FULL_37_9b]OGK40299.1 MAG: hypothetical protein A2954_02760 [Candidatus Roizmanbacteria bacterium RIFCSPLOWO2_01_FULL_37_12]